MPVTKTRAKRTRRAVECWLERFETLKEKRLPKLFWRCLRCKREHAYDTKTCECNFVRPQVADLTRIDEQSTDPPKLWNNHSWTCPDCGHPSNLIGETKICHRCNWDGTAFFPEQEGTEATEIPATQAEAAAKEAAVDGIEPIVLNFSKRARCAVSIDVAQQDGEWRYRRHVRSTWKRDKTDARGMTELLLPHQLPPPTSREAALADAFDALEAQFGGVADAVLTNAGQAARKVALKELASERARLLPGESDKPAEIHTFNDWRREVARRLNFQIDDDDQEKLVNLFHEKCTPAAAAAQFQKQPTATRKPKQQKDLSASPSVRDVPLNLVRENPDNVREDFSGVDRIAESMRRYGQLEECLGRERDGRVELIAGGCRYRAAKLAKLETLRVRILDVDDRAAWEIMGEENEASSPLNAIERARWYQGLLDRGGDELSIRKLAAQRVADGKQSSAGEIANHLRLLKLPEAWQRKVCSREITPTMARSLATWHDRPTVLDAVAQRSTDGMSSAQFDEMLRDVLAEVTRPVTPGERYRHRVRKKSSMKNGVWLPEFKHGDCRITKKVLAQHRDALDVVSLDVHDYRGQRAVEACFNVELWWKLQQEGEAAYSRRQESRSNKSHAAPATKRQELTPAEKRHRADLRRRQLLDKVWRYKVNWYQDRIGERLETADDSQRLGLLLYFQDRDNRPGVQGRAAWNAIHATGVRKGRDLYAAARAAAQRDTATLLLTFLRECLCEGDAHDHRTPLRPADLPAIAEDLGVSLQDEWQCDAMFLEEFAKDQLAALIKEWKLTPGFNGKGKRSWPDKRSDLIAAILKALESQPRNPPKILVKAKG